jgi:methylmalonyl-CoA mutase cobalamin-binding subunit
MKLNDKIECRDEHDLWKTLMALEDAGFRATTSPQEPLTVEIVRVPETQYLAQAWTRNYTRVCYCSTMAEAEEWVADLFQEQNEYELAEICEGYPGEWEPVKRIERKGGEA